MYDIIRYGILLVVIAIVWFTLVCQKLLWLFLSARELIWRNELFKKIQEPRADISASEQTPW